MNGHAVESGSHLTQAGIEAAKTIAHEVTAIKELDASKVKITRATAPRDVPEVNSKEVFDMKTCTDHMVKVTWTSGCFYLHTNLQRT